MRIALLGYGKMGRAVEAAAIERGHTIGAAVDDEDDWMEKLDEVRGCDVAVDFSTPATAVGNIMRCFDMNLPVVVGTTGWYDHLESVAHDCQQRGQRLFVASNFSIGMNIMFELNSRLARLMDSRPGYEVSISETHHIHKIDAPSGTAITLANDIIEELQRKERWVLTEGPGAKPARRLTRKTIPITSIREGEVPGIHEVTYDSDEDTITLRHSAKSRKGLAAGAVLAAEYLIDHTGICTMHDLLAAGESRR